MQEFDRDAVWRAYKRHVTVARRAVDGDAVVHELLAERVNVLHAVGEVAEIAAAAIFVLIPIVGEFDHRRFALACEADILRRKVAMLERGVKVDARDEKDDTALTWAAVSGHDAACRMLLEAGADPNLRQYEGATALMLAADRGHADVVRALIDAKADLDLRHPGQYIPALDFAARAGHREIVALLDEAGASWR